MRLAVPVVVVLAAVALAGCSGADAAGPDHSASDPQVAAVDATHGQEPADAGEERPADTEQVAAEAGPALGSNYGATAYDAYAKFYEAVAASDFTLACSYSNEDAARAFAEDASNQPTADTSGCASDLPDALAYQGSAWVIGLNGDFSYSDSARAEQTDNNPIPAQTTLSPNGGLGGFTNVNVFEEMNKNPAKLSLVKTSEKGWQVNNFVYRPH